MNDLLKAHSEYSSQLGEKEDELWRHYFKTLLPEAGGMEQINKGGSKK